MKYIEGNYEIDSENEKGYVNSSTCLLNNGKCAVKKDRKDAGGLCKHFKRIVKENKEEFKGLEDMEEKLVSKCLIECDLNNSSRFIVDKE